MSADFSLLGMIALGLSASFGHCIGMCSPIVVAYAGAKLGGAGKLRQFFAHLLYALGRTSAYACLGLAFGLIGALLTPSATAKAVFSLFLGALMVAIGLAMLFGSRLLAILENGAIARSALYKRTFGALIASSNMASFYLIGVLNGLIPCGMVYAALAMALNAEGAIGAAGAMAVFGLSSAPSLFAIGLVAGALANFKFRAIAAKISAIFVGLMGVYTLYRAAQALIG
ncbi:MAG: sulfite exporter TauE/SafE family protein [Helicobacteraceae bacterium]|jgi:sulfite exporter TauE/SafE|nr:sulfite exporter TauE/SafE family protein [Helicobacteraceae bacterium]